MPPAAPAGRYRWLRRDGPEAVVSTYPPTRDAEHAATPLAGYSGFVWCDGDRDYKRLAGSAQADGAVILAVRASGLRRP